MRTDADLWEEMKYTKLKAFIATSQGWLKFNLTERLDEYSVPTLIMHPEYDEDLGHTKKMHEKEIGMMPKGIGELVHFQGYSHCMHLEPGGSKLMFDTIIDFLQRREDIEFSL
uniref:Serine aminopeptidase S33 domain-containing protein n=2 Tax=Aplanochytrium stocchinoi TaxID=215587 RepID=A0A6S7ZYP4_9STRA